MPGKNDETINKLLLYRKYKERIEELKEYENYTNYESDLEKLNQFKLSIIHDLLVEKDYIRSEYELQLKEKEEAIQKSIEEINQKITKASSNTDELQEDDIQKMLYGDIENEDDVLNYNDVPDLQDELASLNDELNKVQTKIASMKGPLMTILRDGIGVGESSMITQTKIAEIFYTGNEQLFEQYKNDTFVYLDLEKVIDTYSDFMSSEFVEGIVCGKKIEVSDELENYVTNNFNVYEIVNGLESTDEIEKRENEFKKRHQDIANELKNNPINKKELELEDIENYKTFDEFRKPRKDFEYNARKIRMMLGGLNRDDKEAYTERLREITSIMVESNKKDDPIFRFSGVDDDATNDYKKMSAYIKEIFLKSDEFKKDSLQYLGNTDFTQIGYDAIQKSPLFNDEQELKSIAANMVSKGQNLEANKGFVFNTINEQTSDANKIKAFNKLIDDYLDGKSEVGFFYVKNEKVARTPKNIAIATKTIVDLYNKALTDARLNRESLPASANDRDREEYENNTPKSLDQVGITPEYIKNHSDSITDGEYTANDMERRFNSQLNIFEMNAEEFRTLNSGEVDPDNPIVLKYQVKQRGLNVDKNSDLLNDAIATYGRLKEIHNKRSFYWLFHPFKNHDEKKAIQNMKNTLIKKYGFTEDELNAKADELKDSSFDEINKENARERSKYALSQLENAETTNNLKRQDLLTNELNAIDNSHINEKEAKEENVKVYKSRIVKNGIPVNEDSFDPERPKERNIEELLDRIAATVNLEKQILENKNVDTEKIDAENAKLELNEYEKFVDYDGFKKDKDENFLDLASENKDLLRILKSNDKEKENAAKDIKAAHDKVRGVRKAIRDNNSKLRLFEFKKQLDEYTNNVELNKIDNAKEDEKQTLIKEHEENSKQRENEAKIVEEKIKCINENQEVLKARLEKYSEITDLMDSYLDTFHSLDDSKRGNAQTELENKTLDSFKNKFDLNLEDDTTIIKSKDDDEIGVEYEEVVEENEEVINNKH